MNDTQLCISAHILVPVKSILPKLAPIEERVLSMEVQVQ